MSKELVYYPNKENWEHIHVFFDGGIAAFTPATSSWNAPSPTDFAKTLEAANKFLKSLEDSCRK